MKIEDATMSLTCQGCHEIVTVPLADMCGLLGPPFHYMLAESECCGVCLALSVGARVIP